MLHIIKNYRELLLGLVINKLLDRQAIVDAAGVDNKLNHTEAQKVWDKWGKDIYNAMKKDPSAYKEYMSQVGVDVIKALNAIWETINTASQQNKKLRKTVDSTNPKLKNAQLQLSLWKRKNKNAPDIAYWEKQVAKYSKGSSAPKQRRTNDVNTSSVVELTAEKGGKFTDRDVNIFFGNNPGWEQKNSRKHEAVRNYLAGLGVEMKWNGKKWHESKVKVTNYPRDKFIQSAITIIERKVDAAHWLNKTDIKENNYKKNSNIANQALNKMEQNLNSFDQAWKDNAEISKALTDYCYDDSRGGIERILLGGWNLRKSMSTLNSLKINNPKVLNKFTKEIAILSGMWTNDGRLEGVERTVIVAVLGLILSWGMSVSAYLWNLKFKGQKTLAWNLDVGKIQDLKQWLQKGAPGDRPVYTDYGKNGYQGNNLNKMARNIETVSMNGTVSQKEQAKNTVSRTVDSFLNNQGIPDLQSLKQLFSWYHQWRSPEAPKALQKHINKIDTLAKDGNLNNEKEALVEAKKAYYIVYKEAFREVVNSQGLGNVLRANGKTRLMNNYFKADLKTIKWLFNPTQLRKIHTQINNRTILGCLGKNIDSMSSFYSDAMQTLNSKVEAQKVADRFAGTAGKVKAYIEKKWGKNADIKKHWREGCIESGLVPNYDAIDHSMSKTQKEEIYKRMKEYGMCGKVSKFCFSTIPVTVAIARGQGGVQQTTEHTQTNTGPGTHIDTTTGPNVWPAPVPVTNPADVVTETTFTFQ